MDARVRRRYELIDEDDRLWQPGLGELTRLRTWDVFDRLLPERARIADIGGGPGTHAAYLSRAGHDVILFDPVPRHVERAAARSATGPPFRAELAEARDLPLPNGSVDVALLMGPLYHLTEYDHRVAALAEVARVLRPGGLILAEVITRYAWVMDATRQRLLGQAQTWADFEQIRRTGLSKDPDLLADGAFWAYFHHPDELVRELEVTGFGDIRLVAVEGFAWLLDDLAERLRDPDDLLRAVRLTESEPSMLGASPHLIGRARRP
jgi:SAM-dependent methyltransferase